MFQRRLSISVHRDNAYAPALHQAAVEHLAQSAVVDPTIGQRSFFGAAGRGARLSQPTAWRMGHALRLMAARETPLGGTVEIDELYLGSKPKQQPDAPPSGRGRKASGGPQRRRCWRWCRDLAP